MILAIRLVGANVFIRAQLICLALETRRSCRLRARVWRKQKLISGGRFALWPSRDRSNGSVLPSSCNYHGPSAPIDVAFHLARSTAANAHKLILLQCARYRQTNLVPFRETRSSFAHSTPLTRASKSVQQ